ncbi:MAG: hypothetical protein AAGF31_02335 [Planctomycetota bacterium]
MPFTHIASRYFANHWWAGWSLVTLMAGVTIAGMMVGCTPDRRAEDAQAAIRTQRQREISKSNTLIQFVTEQLRDLPELVSLELRPPAVVLDSTSSQDGRDVMAILKPEPNTGIATFNNYLTVPAGNAGFKRLGVEPGDIIKYFIDIDDESKERAYATGELDSNMVTMVAIELFVAQVIDENTIRIVGGLNQPVLMPHRIEVWRTLDDKMIEINNALGRYAKRGEPMLAWEPSPDASVLSTLIERLNQWLRSRTIADDWAPATLRSTLPKSLRTGPLLEPFLSDAALRSKTFEDNEGRLIQEAIWARDIGRWADGGEFAAVERAKSLFDWTVRNVALTEDPRVLANRPWQSLLYGRGTAAQRAWVFSLLCRQQRLPTVILEVPTEAGPWLWCGLLDEGQLHLFDPQLGLPLTDLAASESGQEGDDTTGAAVLILTDVQGDDALLRAFDLDDSAYPVTADLAKQATAFVVADAFSLSWRASELQQQFSAKDALTLTVEADELAAEVDQLAAVKATGQTTQLWPAPYRLLQRRLTLGEKTRNEVARDFRPFSWRPALWKARALHMRGMIETEADIRAAKQEDALREPRNDHRSAGRLYTSASVRPQDKVLEELSPLKKGIYSRAKADATYWMGLLQYERGAYRSAGQWLDMAVSENQQAGRRSDAIRYNLARAFEAQGELQAAIEFLASGDSLQQHGNRLRAQQLQARLAADRAEAATADAGE